MGGIAKEPEEYPDPYHSYLALAALAMENPTEEMGLKKLDQRWNVGTDTAAWLRDEVNRVRK
jgi:geranylgeranyl transferase type-1 subunit beta